MTTGRTRQHRWVAFADPLYGGRHIGIYGPHTNIDAVVTKLVPKHYHHVLSPIEDLQGHTSILCSEGRSAMTVVVIFNEGGDPLTTLAHEAFHASTQALDIAGLRLSDDSQEAFAYHFSWMFETMKRGLRL